jgi:3D (Asp-Asp-Asp) domain-containing protein
METKQITYRKIFWCLTAVLLISGITLSQQTTLQTSTPKSQSKKESSQGVETGWVCTHYCNCKVCTNKTPADKGYGITASGKSAQEGTIALNWLPFGTKVIIDGKTYTVQDRGSKKLFGDKKNHIKRLDIWCPSHREALKKGIRKNVMVVLKKESL